MPLAVRMQFGELTLTTRTLPQPITLRIPTSLRIAYARLMGIMGITVWNCGDETLILTPRGQRDEERESAAITLHLDQYSTHIEGWDVRIERDDLLSIWQKGEMMCHTDLSGMAISSGWAGDDPEAEARAGETMDEVRGLLPQLQARFARHGWERPYAWIDIAALRPDEVAATVLASHHTVPAEWFKRLGDDIKRVWPDAQKSEAMSYPTRDDDERLFALSADNRKIVALVNQGRTPAQIARLLGTDDADSKMRMNKRISRLRKQHPQLVRPGLKETKRDRFRD